MKRASFHRAVSSAARQRSWQRSVRKLTETEKKLGAADIKCQAVRKEETEMEQLLDEVIRLQHATDEQATIPKEASVEAINVNTDIEKETESR